ncbi:MAG: hypothetical protein LUG60_05365 [Erysipelotrichaceae bacterium]|nr:hypothetical protein [Erysipelotrichaceae bacterium]
MALVHDSDLKNVISYSEGQKEAAHRVLVELVNLFGEYEEDFRIVGGWVPTLMFPQENHIGSVDVDILINHLTLQDAGYLSMSRILLKNGYVEHPEKYFSFVKDVEINGEIFSVDVDILAGIYGGTTQKKRSQHVQGVRALKATGGNFAFEFPPQKVIVEAERSDGVVDVANVNLVAVVPFLVMKTAALGRGKPKDAYDIYFVVKYYPGGVKMLAEEFTFVRDRQIILDMKQKLAGKFASMNHAGVVDVVNFMDIDDEEYALYLKKDVYSLINMFIRVI